MRKVFLSAGHSSTEGKDRGAIYKDKIEGVLTAKVRADLFDVLCGYGADVIVDDDDKDTFETIKEFSKLVKHWDVAIDIHFNNFATNPHVGGTEVFIGDTNTKFEEDLATQLAITISKSLSIRNRGVKRERESQHKSLAWMKLKCETVLIEICFLSSDSDMAKFDRHYWLLINDMAKVIVEHLKK
jgi:N-acetylmuramoyl-L-alanine amidase